MVGNGRHSALTPVTSDVEVHARAMRYALMNRTNRVASSPGLPMFFNVTREKSGRPYVPMLYAEAGRMVAGT